MSTKRRRPIPAESGQSSATRTKLLDAAESLFARRGADGISIRQITAAAHANLGAVNYHFGDKDRLLMAVFSRRLKAVNHARIARLDALERRAGKKPPAIRDIVDAFIRPAVEGRDEGVGHSEAMSRLMSRSHCEQNPALKEFVEEQFEEVVRRFDASILRALPGLTPTGVYWRMVYLVGALGNAQDYWLRWEEKPHPGHRTTKNITDLGRPDLGTFIREAVDFFAGGFTATGTPAKKSAAAKRPRARRK